MIEENESPITLNDKEVIIEKRTRKFGIFSIIITILIILMSALLIQFEVRYSSYKVSGVSMQPTLSGEKDKNDFVYVNKFSKIEKGDIVVLKYAQGGIDNIVKRVIATGGDTINIVGIGPGISAGEGNPSIYKKYGIKVNDIIIEEKYLITEDNPYDPLLMQIEFLKFFNHKKKLAVDMGKKLSSQEIEEMFLTISEKALFVLGDNRKDSTDSTYFGEVNLSEKIGRVDFIVPYSTSIWEHFLKKISFLFIFK